MSLFHDQAEFMKAGKIPVGEPTYDVANMASGLIFEEFEEWNDEHTSNTEFCPYMNINDIKESLDLLYVTLQYLNVQLGPDKALECFKALHDNNMSKCEDGVLVKSPEGKVLKPANYRALDLTPLLEDL